ncbi:hypothetical protein [Pelagibius marinus]|uniref:hypothetical protein n=1 Tax=Pelagibius marinus TaxID=2762760 RepID=UPI001872C919|nr:hypothetical protein [Pelagibius marinus]
MAPHKSLKQPRKQPTRAPLRIGSGALALGLLLAVSTLPVFAAADLPGAASGTLAAVFAPGTDRAAALAAVAEADGLVVRGGGWGSVLVARSDQAGFAARLRRAGAWLVVDPRSAAGCLIAGIQQTKN